jgi:hypothetical protein
MTGNDEMVFLKTHLGQLTLDVLCQLKWGILAKKKSREAMPPAKAEGSSKQP